MTQIPQFSFATNETERDAPKDEGVKELQREQELLTLLGDPKVRVSVPTFEDRAEAERAEADQPPVSRRYQVG